MWIEMSQKYGHASKPGKNCMPMNKFHKDGRIMEKLHGHGEF